MFDKFKGLAFDIFSKRRKRSGGGSVDVFQYTDIPETLRVQIFFLIEQGLGSHEEYIEDEFMRRSGGAYKEIVKALRREYGVFEIAKYSKSSRSKSDYFVEFMTFVLSESNVEKVIDGVELAFSAIIVASERWYGRFEGIYAELANELNFRIREAGVGFSLESGKFIRVDSTFIHQEVTKIGLTFLSDKRFSGANSEFLAAHEHYRMRRYKESILECAKSLESVLKTIFIKKRWIFPPASTLSKLIAIAFERGLIPEYMQSQFNSLRGLLESGVGSIRNKVAGHGQGQEIVTVPDHLAAYSLHLTTSTIVFLIECDHSSC